MRNKNTQKDTFTAQNVKLSIAKGTDKELKDTYKKVSILIENKLKNQDKNNFNELDLKRLQKEINNELKNITTDIKSIIEDAVVDMVEKTIENNLEYYKKIDKKYNTNLYGFFAIKYKMIKDTVIKMVVGGNMYKDNHSLSDRVWKDLKKNQTSIDLIITQGLKNKDHPLDIAKKLEKYVNPSKAKEFKWSVVYPGSKTKIEYNALRLARTSINHAHHQSVIEIAKRNPLVTHIEWLSAGAHGRTCEMCSNRDGKVYPIDKVPQDHPNGMCDLLEVQPSDEMFERLMNEFMESSYDDFMDFMNDYDLDDE